MTEDGDTLLVVGTAPARIVPYAAGADGVWEAGAPLAKGLWPVPNPVFPVVAVSQIDFVGDQPISRIVLVDRDDGSARMVYESTPGEPAVIAAGLPHYCYWSPTGRHLAYGVAGEEGFSVSVVPVSGGAPVLVTRGSPIFLGWSPDGRLLAAHVGQRLEVFDVAAGRTVGTLAHDAVGFRNPLFSPDGRHVVFATADRGQLTVRVADTSSFNVRPATVLPGGAAFAFRPGSDELLAAVTRDAESGQFSEVWVGDVEGRGAWRRHAMGRPGVGFFWSPTGETLIQVEPAQTGDGRYRLLALDAELAPYAATEPLLPTAEFRAVLSFFDQYTVSHPLWNAAGTRFAIAGRVLNDSLHESFSDAQAWVYTWQPERGEPLRAVAAGEIGVFEVRGGK